MLWLILLSFLGREAFGSCPSTDWPIASRSLSRNCCDLYPWEWTQKQTLASLALSNRIATQENHKALVPRLADGQPCGPGQAFNVFGECSIGGSHTNFKEFVEESKALESENKPLSIYVGQRDFDEFLTTVFPSIKTHFILVVAQEDSGSPLGLWGLPASRGIVPVPQITALNLTTFLQDDRVLRLYVQNYDLTPNACHNFNGRNPKQTSTESCRLEITHFLDTIPTQAKAKITPIPIGIDMHSLAELTGSKGGNKHNSHPYTKVSECTQVLALETAQKSAPSWPSKLECLSVTFTGGVNFACRRAAPPMFICFREWILRSARQGSSAGHYCMHEHIGSRNSTWHGLATTAFGIAPPGHGTDTHRFWEMLLLKVVPVVISSSLDILYEQFPCIILKDWREALINTPNIIATWKQTIIDRWGPDPFTPELMHRLSTNYWADLISKGLPLPPVIKR